MSCPHLAIVTMSYCRAYPVKKLIPAEGASFPCRCSGDHYQGCPAFEEASRRILETAKAPELSSHEVSSQGGRS